MKAAFVLGLLFAQAAIAAAPTKEVVLSCLAAQPYAPSVSMEELPTQEVLTDDSYRPGFAATYLLQLKTGEVGLAHGKQGDALIEAGRLYMLADARPLMKAGHASTFEPQLASWLHMSEGTSRYLCVSFNFPGLGHSGDFQRMRGGYLLPLTTPLAGRRLYYAVADVGEVQLPPR